MNEKEINSQSLKDRKEAQAEWLLAMQNNPEIIGERIGWLLNGSYGSDEFAAAKMVADSPRMNRVAALAQLIAVHEWMCPRFMAVSAWKKLTDLQKKILHDFIESAILTYEEEKKLQEEVK